MLKAGFVWSGKLGSGIVIARLEDGSFSAPSCIASGGVGVGFQIGADISEVRLPSLTRRGLTRWETVCDCAQFARGGTRVCQGG